VAEPVDGVVLRVADAVGALMEAWGFKRNMGRLWGLLYLEQRPLSAQDIGDRLALSSGAVSMLLTELQQWSIVKKTWIPGERREHFEAETSIWKMVSRVFRERELRWIEDALGSFESAQRELAAEPAPESPDAARDHLDSRISALTELARVGAHLLRAILDGAAVDALPLKTVGELAQGVPPPGKKQP
jgi:HTH-type transcriptional regulator, glycine betaine synthesis regulator